MLRQSASGTGPTFCSARSGNAYDGTAEATTCTPRSGVEPVASDLVFVSDQVSSWLELPVPFASGAAFVLRKYSVPPARVSYDAAVGDCDGHTVNPGWPPGAARPVSIWVTRTDSAPLTIWAFDMA